MIEKAVTALVCGFLFLLSAVAAQADKRVVLVVGNSAYQHVPALARPASDAKALAAKFQEAGFAVVDAQYDVTNLLFKRAIRQFEDAAVDADIAVIYYAGHGIEINGVNYLIPVDATLARDEDAADEAVPLDRLVAATDGAKRLRLVILDAGRDNPFVSTMKRAPTPHGVAAGLGKADPSETNTLIAYAAKAGSVALEGDGEHSPFAAALLDNLFIPGLDIRLAFGRIRDQMLKQTGNRQEPFVYGALGGGNLSLVPGPDRAAAPDEDTDAVKSDYRLVAVIGTKSAWQVFIAQHPTGYFAEVARLHIAALERAEKAAAEALQKADEAAKGSK